VRHYIVGRCDQHGYFRGAICPSCHREAVETKFARGSDCVSCGEFCHVAMCRNFYPLDSNEVTEISA